MRPNIVRIYFIDMYLCFEKIVRSAHQIPNGTMEAFSLFAPTQELIDGHLSLLLRNLFQSVAIVSGSRHQSSKRKRIPMGGVVVVCYSRWDCIWTCVEYSVIENLDYISMQTGDNMANRKQQRHYLKSQIHIRV